MLNICHLKKDPILDNRDIDNLLFWRTFDRPEHGDQANDVDSENAIQYLISDNGDIEDLIFQSALIMPEHARPHSTKIIGPGCSFHGQLHAKKPIQSTNFHIKSTLKIREKSLQEKSWSFSTL